MRINQLYYYHLKKYKLSNICKQKLDEKLECKKKPGLKRVRGWCLSLFEWICKLNSTNLITIVCHVTIIRSCRKIYHGRTRRETFFFNKIGCVHLCFKGSNKYMHIGKRIEGVLRKSLMGILGIRNVWEMKQMLSFYYKLTTLLYKREKLTILIGSFQVGDRFE